MAIITFSPLIVTARGKAGDAVFATWKGRNYVRKLVTPANPKSAAQTVVRESLARLVPCWRAFIAWVKTAQNKYATGYRMSGYNWFMSQNRVHEEDYETEHILPPNPDSDTPATITLTDSGGGTCKVDWTGGDQTANKYMVAFHRKVETADEAAVFTLNDDLNTLSTVLTFNLTLEASKDHIVAIGIRNPGYDEVSGSIADAITMGA